MKKYLAPNFLSETVIQSSYEKWLHRKAMAHVKRDRNRKNSTAKTGAYKEAIHRAVVESDGRDFYTGEALDWSLISTYANDLSKQGGRVYKARFSLLPTVDHVNDGLGPADFKICSWRTNDAKNDMTLVEFIALCSKVVMHQQQLAAAATKKGADRQSGLNGVA